MNYRRLRENGPKVSSICLGTMTFGSRTNASSTDQIIIITQNAGIIFIDTADVYAKRESERNVGRLIAKGFAGYA